MFDHASPDPSLLPPQAWTAERYLETLHPRGGRGVVGGLTFEGTGVRAHTWSRDLLPSVAATLIEQESYVALNPYYGPRGAARRLAALNAVWLDLDTYKVPALRGLERNEIADRILAAISAAALPRPSLIVDSGRGFYCIWLISGAVPAALPRWRAVMRALTQWARPLGADPACVDPARVLRLPGSWHEGACRQVTIVSGDGARHPFDLLADAVWRAAGRPSRQDLDAARSKRRDPDDSGRIIRAGSRGLPRRTFWAEIRRDLDRLLDHWGGAIPVGMRDLWLHIHCCALTWTETNADILALVLQRATTAAPGLMPKEVARMMGSTIRRGLAAVAGQPRTCDPRYDYASDRLCDLLSVDRRLATDLGFRQLLPADLRAERNRQRRVERRRAAGVLPRAIWLAAHPISRLKPWEAEGVSRATWYRRQAEAQRRRLQACLGQLMAGSAGACALRETGPVPLYKGEASAPLGIDPTIGLDSSSALANSHPNPEAPKKTTRAGQPRCAMAAPAAAFAGAGGVNSSPATTTTEAAVPDRPALDLDVLKAAAERLIPNPGD